MYGGFLDFLVGPRSISMILHRKVKERIQVMSCRKKPNWHVLEKYSYDAPLAPMVEKTTVADYTVDITNRRQKVR
jgi:hypothetical protein